MTYLNTGWYSNSQNVYEVFFLIYMSLNSNITYINKEYIEIV